MIPLRHRGFRQGSGIRIFIGDIGDIKRTMGRTLLSGIICLWLQVIASLGGPIAFCVSSPPSFAQTPSSTQAFEVASVKPTEPGTHDFHFRSPNHGIDAVNIPLEEFILYAYNLKSIQLTGGPDWIRHENYDIVAKAPANATNDQIPKMLQTLLAERFKLANHGETRVLPIYALSVGKGGPKFRARTEARPGDGNFKIGAGRLSGQGVTMHDLADMLVRVVDRIVVEKTGLAGKFDINLQWTPDVTSAIGNDREAAPDPNGPSLVTALSEQLGLRLEPSKAPVPVVIIDHVEKPTAN
jgi:uncharacterized protein (TIGR03435 family)